MAAAQARDVEHASERLAQAEAAGAQTRAALALAERAEATALQAEGLDLYCAAHENVCAAEGELQRSDDEVAEATASLELAKAPRNHPVNLAFSPRGSTTLSQLVDTWQEAEPYNHTLPDDVRWSVVGVLCHPLFVRSFVRCPRAPWSLTG